MRLWEELGEMKKRLVLKKEFFLIETLLVSGVQKIKGLSFGICSILGKIVDEHFRVFPISNWTEIDVWRYIQKEKILLPTLYFSHKRECIIRDGVILAKSNYLQLKEGGKNFFIRCPLSNMWRYAYNRSSRIKSQNI